MQEARKHVISCTALGVEPTVDLAVLPKKRRLKGRSQPNAVNPVNSAEFKPKVSCRLRVFAADSEL